MANKESFDRRSPAESDIIRPVWEKIGSELIEEFVVPTIPGDRSRAREIDGVLAVDGPTQRLARCADPAWWTQTIAFTAVDGRAPGG
jgi:hypothetical protein